MSTERIVFVLPLLATVPSMAQAPSLIGLSGPNGSLGEGNCVSADGNTVAGAGTPTVMRWTRQGGVTALTDVNGGWAYGASADGAVIVGQGGFTGVGFPRAYRWTQQTGPLNLGVLPGTLDSSANGVSTDGSIVVGTCTNNGGAPNKAFRWTVAGGMQQIPLPTSQSSASAISADGSVIVGNADTGAYRLEGNTFLSLGLGPTGSGTAALAVSPNGRNVVGSYFHSGLSRNQPFIWTPESGFQTIPTLGFGNVAANGVTDSKFVVGVFTDPGQVVRAWVWSPSLGVQYLTDYLAARGIPGAATVQLHDAMAVNATGKVITGLGSVPGYQNGAFRAELCYANCDDSTGFPSLNVADFSCFLQRFSAGDAYANCDGSTTAPTLNVQDFTCFLQKFAAGCSAP